MQQLRLHRDRSAFMRIRSGVTSDSAVRLKTAASESVVKAMRHLKTVRGHHSPVYCCAVDKEGKLAITGSDDSFVKVHPDVL